MVFLDVWVARNTRGRSSNMPQRCSGLTQPGAEAALLGPDGTNWMYRPNRQHRTEYSEQEAHKVPDGSRALG